MQVNPQAIKEIREPQMLSTFPSFELKKKKKKKCCEKYKRKGKRCGSCPLKGCS
ncbi:MAG: hypothetical protein ACJAVL_001205 [Bacteroidia bacterium]